jgi:curved DNA-binding protein CbpA
MENRRNYYRILEVQPDAPLEVIRQNYMLLLHKLRRHPDLGGNHRDAALINLAFETLSDPQRRAAYDRELLKRYDIVTLSMGNLRRPGLFSRPSGRGKASAEAGPMFNRRNYYRLLGVQPDAHPAIIRERCLALFKGSALPKALVNEAYEVLNNVRKRAEYDRLLKHYGHSEAVKRMQIRGPKQKGEKGKARGAGAGFPASTREKYAPASPAAAAGAFPAAPGEPEFEPLITQYCYFCKTPHNFDPKTGADKFCLVCASPLFSATEDMSGTTRRALMRVRKSGPLVFYVYWPSREFAGELFDLSPNGLCFRTEYGLDVGQVIKIDAENFKAVGEVVHTRAEEHMTSNGVHFRAVAFDSPKGNFVNVRF